MKNVRLLAFGVMVAAAIVARHPRHAATAPDPATAAAATPLPGGGGNPWALGGDNGPHALTLARDGSGQFHLSARVNGRPAQFLVDTGADTVAITQDQAQALGLRVDPADYVVPVHSASGSAMAARVPLSQIEIGGRTMSDVEALVVPGLRQNLLGQSALRRLGRVELSGDTMVLDPR